MHDHKITYTDSQGTTVAYRIAKTPLHAVADLRADVDAAWGEVIRIEAVEVIDDERARQAVAYHA